MSNTITGRVIATKYAGTSTMGNPSYWVTIQRSDGYSEMLRTMSNAMIGYAIQNPEYRDEPHVFTLTAAGRIRSARKQVEA